MTIATIKYVALRGVALAGVFTGALLGGCSDGGTSPIAGEARAELTNAARAGDTAVTPATPVRAVVTDPASGATYASVWGPSIGSKVPMLAATDQTGKAQNLASLAGEKGLLLVFSRSADW